MSPGFDFFCALLAEHSGLELSEEKRYLVDTRLAPIAERLQLPSVDALLTKLQFGADRGLIGECVEALATHESSFFRDRLPFEQLSKIILPRLLKEKDISKSLRIWSIGCSTGQEPYSIAMTLHDHASVLQDWHVEILATDLVASTVEHARRGFFTDFEISRGLSGVQVARFFKKVDGGYLIDATLRRNINFQAHNLLEPAIQHGPFDLVFCRNVLIYFNRERKVETLQRIATVLGSEGLLILGSAETVIGICDTFESFAGQRGLFQRRAATSLLR